MITWFQGTIRLAPTWATGDQWNIAWGVVEGGVSVLPTDSMIAYCKNNATDISTQITYIGTKFTTTGGFIDGLKGIQALIKDLHGSLFNCYYTVTNPVQAAQYNKDFTFYVIGWNILFNLGYMYTNIKMIYTFLSTTTPVSTKTYGDLGKNIGSFLVRFIYSKYQTRNF